MSSLLVLILFTWFSLSFFVTLTKAVDFVYLFKKRTLILLKFCFLVSILFMYALIFVTFFLLLVLGLLCSFSGSLMCNVKLFESFFSFLMQAFIAQNPPFRITFSTSYKFWYIVFLFIFVRIYFKISLSISSLTHWLFRGMLLHFQTFASFERLLLVLICSFTPLWLENMFDMIAIFIC